MSPGADDAEDGVHVRAVEVHERASIVQELGDLADLGVEQPDRVGVGDHEDGGLVVELRSEVGEVDEAARVALDGDGLEPGEVRRGRVGAVGAVGDEDLRPRFALVAEVGGSDQERRQLAMRAGRRLEADGGQASDLGEVRLQVVQQTKQPLER